MSSKIHGLSMFIIDLSSFTKDAICRVSTIIRQAHSCFGFLNLLCLTSETLKPQVSANENGGLKVPVDLTSSGNIPETGLWYLTPSLLSFYWMISRDSNHMQLATTAQDSM